MTAQVVANFGLVYAQLEALARKRAAESYTRETLIFLLAFGVWYLLGERLWKETAVGLADGVRGRARHIIARTRDLSVDAFDRVARDALTVRLTADARQVATASSALIGLPQALIRLGLGGLFAASVSPVAARVAIFGLVLMGLVLAAQARIMRDGLHAARPGLDRLFVLLRDCVGGAVGIRLHPGRARAIRAAIDRWSTRLVEIRVAALGGFFGRQNAANAILYALLGINVFLLPLATEIDMQAVRDMNLLLVWIIAAVVGVVFTLPEIARAADALERVDTLAQRLDQQRSDHQGPMAAAGPLPAPTEHHSAFGALQLRGLRFAFPASAQAAGFAVGPIDADFAPGELVFVTGHNGSGKSTFVRMISGLYDLDDGEIRVDGAPVTAEGLRLHRSRFAVIFARHHLFAELDGLNPAQRAALPEKLRRLGIEQKVTVDGGRLSVDGLSTGQEKRLALALALVRECPIVIFDEWAAEQDPESRATFYNQILPELAAAGRLVFVVTHDDDYFHTAGRILEFREGRLVRDAAATATRGGGA